MFHSILVAVDGSRHAERALQEAIDMARQGNTRLTIVTTVPDPSTWLITGGAYGGAINHQALMEESEREYHKLLEEAVDKVPQDIPVTKRLMHGKPGQQIVEALKEGGHDLVIMGSRGRGDISSIVLGSVSHQVLNATRTSVLIVHADTEESSGEQPPV